MMVKKQLGPHGDAVLAQIMLVSFGIKGKKNLSYQIQTSTLIISVLQYLVSKPVDSTY